MNERIYITGGSGCLVNNHPEHLDLPAPLAPIVLACRVVALATIKLSAFGKLGNGQGIR